jgi:hypothetical protein
MKAFRTGSSPSMSSRHSATRGRQNPSSHISIRLPLSSPTLHPLPPRHRGRGRMVQKTEYVQSELRQTLRRRRAGRGRSPTGSPGTRTCVASAARSAGPRVSARAFTEVTSLLAWPTLPRDAAETSTSAVLGDRTKRQTKSHAKRNKRVVEEGPSIGTHNLARAQLQEAMPGLDHSYGLQTNQKKKIIAMFS